MTAVFWKGHTLRGRCHTGCVKYFHVEFCAAQSEINVLSLKATVIVFYSLYLVRG